jgi:1,5-anhydro-D-fructose reductase (1,5-anhydro-D-mannitol-forming)
MKWILIGASDIAATRVIPAMLGRGDTIAAVVSSNAEHGLRFAARHGIEQASTDLEGVLADADADAVYISSRNHLHASQSVAAAAAGKHVLCEKPMALSADDARQSLQAAATAGVIFAVNHHLPGSATHRAIRRLISDGAIGRPLAVSVCHAVMLPERLQDWRLGSEPGAGVVLDITCHDASVVNAALSGPATSAAAVGVSQGRWVTGSADAVMSSLTYGTVTVQTHDAFTVEHRPTRFDVFGTDGAILATDVMTQDPVGEVVLRTSAGERTVDVGDRQDLYQTVLDGFAAAVAGAGEPTVSGAAGANAFLVADAVSRSITTGRTVSVDCWFGEEAPFLSNHIASAGQAQ